MTIKVKLLEPIEGYSDIAEYRRPLKGEVYYGTCGPTHCELDMSRAPWLVLTPLPKWRPATLEDAIRAIKGEKVKARFRDNTGYDWHESELTGCTRQGKLTWHALRDRWAYCEVLDV
jgi:hypothetical protein